MDAGDAGGLHAGFRQRLRDRSAAGGAPRGPELAAESGLRPLRRAAIRLAVHGAARQQRTLVALPHPAVSEARAEVQADVAAPLEDRTRNGRARPPDWTAALGAGADTQGAAHISRGHAHD